MSRYVKNEKGSAKSFSADFSAVKKGLKKARAATDEKRWKEMAKFYESDKSLPTLKKSKFPSEKELKEVRKKLSRKQGSLVLSKDATPLEKLRYEICKQFVIYKRENELKSKELAKIVGVDTSIMSKVLKYRNERFSTDKLIEMLAKIYPKHDLLLKIAA